MPSRSALSRAVAPPGTASLSDDRLREALYLPLGSDGVNARTSLHENVVDGLSRLLSSLRPAAAEVLRLPPVMSRAQLESSGYLDSFPHLLGCVSCLPEVEGEVRAAAERREGGLDWTGALHAADLVLTPAACYPLYPLVAGRGPVASAGLTFDVACDCFRREPSRDLNRLQSFRMREFVRIGSPDQVRRFRARWLREAENLAGRLGLDFRIERASDPFFGRGGAMLARSQYDKALKFELLSPIGAANVATACMSFNNHEDHFGATWGLHSAAGEVRHSGCVAFGLDRLTLALFSAHGLDLSGWPEVVRKTLGMS